MKISMILMFLLLATALMGYEIQQYTTVFVDADRNNRQIQTVIYYPTGGGEPEIRFPYMVFGHGWLMNHANYSGLISTVVGQGYIMAFPRTEEGLTPNHAEFALDLSFLREMIQSGDENPSSPLYQKVHDVSILMGHSMGGGAAILAAAQEDGYHSVITFAAAETNVSAIAAAAQIDIPALMFSGSADTIAPPAQHQMPIYHNLGSDYKAYVSFTGAGHLNLYNNALVASLLTSWIEYLKSGHISHLEDFETVLETNPNSITYLVYNNLSVSLDPEQGYPIPNSIHTYPNPFSAKTTMDFELSRAETAQIAIYNLKGQRVFTIFEGTIAAGKHVFTWDTCDNKGQKMAKGIYLLQLQTGASSQVTRLILQ